MKATAAGSDGMQSCVTGWIRQAGAARALQGCRHDYNAAPRTVPPKWHEGGSVQHEQWQANNPTGARIMACRGAISIQRPDRGPSNGMWGTGRMNEGQQAGKTEALRGEGGKLAPRAASGQIKNTRMAGGRCVCREQREWQGTGNRWQGRPEGY